MRWIIWAALGALIATPAAQAEEVCVEELAGVCLRYETRAAPKAPKAPKREPRAAAQLSPAEAAERALRLTAADRRGVQTALKRLGHYSGAVDGALGRGSRLAIAIWQQGQGLQPTGYLDITQVAMLKRPAAPQPTPAPPSPEEKAAAPTTAAPTPAAQSADPVIGRAYKLTRERSGYFTEMTVTALSATEGEFRLMIDGPGGRLDQSCRISLVEQFRCTMTQRGFAERRIEGRMPIANVFSSGLASAGAAEYKFW